MILKFSAKREVVFDFFDEFPIKPINISSTKIVDETYLNVLIEYFLQESNQILITSIRVGPAKKEENVPQFLQFPKEIQRKMVNHSTSKSPIPFLKDITVLDIEGGFDWVVSPEGLHFWREIIEDGNFATFYEKYPLTSNISISKNLISASDYIVMGTNF